MPAIAPKKRKRRKPKENVRFTYDRQDTKYAPELEEDTIVEKKEMNPKLIQRLQLTDKSDHNESLLILAKELKDKHAVKLLGIKDMHKVYDICLKRYKHKKSNL